MSDDSVTLDTLSERLAKVERIQRTNLPKFRNVLKRLAAMEKSMATAIASLTEIRRDATDQTERSKANAELLAANSEKIEHIFAFVTHSQTAYGLLRKHGPRFFAFAIGAAVATGRLTPEWAQKILHLFGL